MPRVGNDGSRECPESGMMGAGNVQSRECRESGMPRVGNDGSRECPESGMPGAARSQESKIGAKCRENQGTSKPPKMQEIGGEDGKMETTRNARNMK